MLSNLIWITKLATCRGRLSGSKVQDLSHYSILIKYYVLFLLSSKKRWKCLPISPDVLMAGSVPCCKERWTKVWRAIRAISGCSSNTLAPPKKIIYLFGYNKFFSLFFIIASKVYIFINNLKIDKIMKIIIRCIIHI